MVLMAVSYCPVCVVALPGFLLCRRSFLRDIPVHRFLDDLSEDNGSGLPLASF